MKLESDGRAHLVATTRSEIHPCENKVRGERMSEDIVTKALSLSFLDL